MGSKDQGVNGKKQEGLGQTNQNFSFSFSFSLFLFIYYIYFLFHFILLFPKRYFY